MSGIEERAIAHLIEKWKGKACPMCQVGPWEIQDVMFGLTAFTPGYIRPGLPTMPLIPVTCRNCGYTVLVNAKSAGIVSDDELNNYKPEPAPRSIATDSPAADTPPPPPPPKMGMR